MLELSCGMTIRSLGHVSCFDIGPPLATRDDVVHGAHQLRACKHQKRHGKMENLQLLEGNRGTERCLCGFFNWWCSRRHQPRPTTTQRPNRVVRLRQSSAYAFPVKDR